MAELPHDRSGLLWKGDNLSGIPTSLFLDSMDRWIDAMVFDEQGGGSGTKKNIIANVIMKEGGIICGIPVVNRLVERYFQSCKIIWNLREGDRIKNGEILLKIKGESVEILKLERIMLNILGNLSGIATNTREWVRRAAPVKVAATRKTDWGILDKWAVHVGGGLTHRLNRGDAMMLKENDFASMKLKNEDDIDTLTRVISHIEYKGDFVIIEVQNLKNSLIIVDLWKNYLNRDSKIILLLDNMGPKLSKKVSLSLKEANLREYCILEGSGNIVLDSIIKWSDSEVEVVSSSRLNRGISPLDLTMIFEGASK